MRTNRWAVLWIPAILAVALAGCATKPEVRLIPRQMLLGDLDRAGMLVSPDGTKISFLAPHDGAMNVWVAPRANLTAAAPVTRARRGIEWYAWAYTNQHILYRQDNNGDENWGIHVVDLATGQDRDLTQTRKTTASLPNLSDKAPHEVVIAFNDRDASDADLHQINLLTGQDRILLSNPRKIEGEQVGGFVLDADLHARSAWTLPSNGGVNHYLKTTPDAAPATQPSWRPFPGISAADTGQVGTLNFNRGGDLLYVQDARGRDTLALSAIDTATGQTTVLAEDAQADLDDFLVHPYHRTVQAAAFDYDRRRWQVIDPEVAEDFQYLTSMLDGHLRITGQSLDNQIWTIAKTTDTSPVRHYIYDRAARQLQFAFVGQKDLSQQRLAPMHSAIIKSRDGLDLVSYYTLPLSAAPNGAAQPAWPLPMVLLVHGGPWQRDQWGLHLEHQWLVNRGYAVLSVNFRGSSGFGKNFTSAGNREWGGKMQEDLIDAVNWAIREKIADPRRIAIMGGSYGGYAALAGLTFTPDTFACAIDLCGPAHLPSLMKTFSPAFPQLRIRIGDEKTAEGLKLLENRSPLNYVDRIRRPLLIVHGANDPRVSRAESDRIVEAMQAKGIPVTYLLYPDEGHGLARPENRLSFYAVVEAFLAQHLGGRVEPIAEDVRRSSVEIRAGRERIRQLRPARRERLLVSLPP